jgi:radical SAM-linked protein
MATDPTAAAETPPAAPDPPAAPPAPSPGARARLRFRFRKDGALRWLSHHDLLRTFERILRRSGLPFRNTQGFNPHPRIVFALSLPLGVVGRSEVVELELDEEVPPEEACRRLQEQCPAGLTVLECRPLPRNAGVRVRGLCYAVGLPADRIGPTGARIAEVLSGGPCWVERAKPERRRLDVRPFLRDLRLDDQTGWLEMDLWLLPTGTARPDEVLGLLGLGDLLEAGAVLERLRLEMEDESPPPAPPAGVP